jgi:hypothetical protein
MKYGYRILVKKYGRETNSIRRNPCFIATKITAYPGIMAGLSRREGGGISAAQEAPRQLKKPHKGLLT